MEISIIIVNWNVKKLLRHCLSSLFQYSKNVSFEVFVVDNASSDGSVEMIEKEFPDVRLIRNDKNLGFAAANNQAIKEAKGEFIFLLNPDTELLENIFIRLIAFMRERKDIGICGPRVLGTDGNVQRSVRRFPKLRDQALILLKLHHLFPKLKSLQSYFSADMDYEKEQEVDQVIGAAFMIRQSLFKEIGLFDESFFLWFEEVDFCKRAKDAGFKVVYTPRATLLHHGGESFRQKIAPAKQRILNRSLYIYMRKHYGIFHGSIVIILYPLAMFLAYMGKLLRFTRKKYDYTSS